MLRSCSHFTRHDLKIIISLGSEKKISHGGIVAVTPVMWDAWKLASNRFNQERLASITQPKKLG